MPRLTDKQRKQIVADYVELGSYAAVAKKHGVADTTVKRAVEQDRQKLDDETGLFGSITDEEISQNAGKTYADATSLHDPTLGYGLGGLEEALNAESDTSI